MHFEVTRQDIGEMRDEASKEAGSNECLFRAPLQIKQYNYVMVSRVRDSTRKVCQKNEYRGW